MYNFRYIKYTKDYYRKQYMLVYSTAKVDQVSIILPFEFWL